MDAAQLANLAGSAFLCTAALAAAVVYQVKARWWKSLMGRHFMGVNAGLAMLGLYTLLMSLVWQAGPMAAALRVVRTVVTVFLGVMMLLRVVLMVRAEDPPDEDREQ
jgi:hypothetical protein